MPRVLVIYWYRGVYPLRSTIRDHLFCFRREARDARTVYLNLAFRWALDVVAKMSFDLVIFHTLFFEVRGSAPEEFARVLEEAKRAASRTPCRVGMPQDEHFKTDLIHRLALELGMTHILTCAPESEWKALYDPARFGGVAFCRALPGYLSSEFISRVERLGRTAGRRAIDIGYRVRPARPSDGRHGMLKSQVADAVAVRARRRGMKVDIAVGENRALLGARWTRFLLRCRCVLGAEGGASLLDCDGSIRRRGEGYMATHPGAEFDEVEAACFPNLDGGIRYVSISPRHLEACATRTCQILVEGEYNGILQAGVHFLALRKDFSNIEEVLDNACDEELTNRIAERARREVVDSGRFDYGSFVSSVLRLSADAGPRTPASWTPGRQALADLQDAFNWLLVILRHCLWTRPRRLVKALCSRGNLPFPRGRTPAADAAP
ncbi:MAG: hypothetical protein QME60_00805 [Verrucomicrobiota bacterium]|nr:hypothetical protein [Verrucomicrobiota bacterium]